MNRFTKESDFTMLHSYKKRDRWTDTFDLKPDFSTSEDRLGLFVPSENKKTLTFGHI